MRRFVAAALSILLLGHPLGAQAAGGLQTGRVMGDLSFAHVGSQTLTQALAGSGAGGGVSPSLIGAANGLATLDGNKLLLTSQIPFGNVTGSVADGGKLATTAATASAAIPSSMIGAASGVASLNGSKQLPAAQIPFGTAAGTVADGGVLATTAATASSAIPSSMIGAANGVASLSGAKLLTAAQVPFGTTTGTVADGGALANTTSSLQSFMQSAATTFLGVAGDASTTIVKALSDSAGRTLASWAGDVYNLADHGADGTATGDDAALAKAITYAAARQGTIIYLPQNINGQPWQFLASSGVTFNYCFPSNTTFAGAGINSTSIAWNDTVGTYLFGSSFNGTVSPGVRPVNITLRDFKVIGTWTKPDTAYPSGDFTEVFADAIGVGSVDGLTIRNVESDYSRYFGMSPGYSTNVLLDGDVVNYSFADGISGEGSSGILATNIKISHTNDDCFSAHNALGDTEGLRRDVQIDNLQCFDTELVSLNGAQSASLNNITVDSPKTGAISIVATQGGTSSTEGNSAMGAISLSNITVRNMLDRSSFNSYGGGNTAIRLIFTSSRAGNLAGVPGASMAAANYKIIDPYPYTLNNSASTNVPMRINHGVSLENIQVYRTYPATNTSALPNWSALGAGVITGSNGFYNPSLPESALQGGCLDITDGYVLNLSVDNFTCEGESYFANIVNNVTNVPGTFDGMVFSNIHGYDLSSWGIAESAVSGDVISLIVRNSDFDLDPYDKNGSRGGSGNWNSLSGCNEVVFCKAGSYGSLLAYNNSVRDAAEDTNVDTTDPTTGWEFRNNYDFAEIGVPNAFSVGQNFGIGFPHPGFDIVNSDEIPGDPLYHSITSVKVAAAPAMPTSGMWHQGDYVRDTAPTASNPVAGWLRLTTGTSDVLGTDWAAK